MGISEDALAMKAYIEEHGWTQGEGVNEDTGGVCLIGAKHYSGVRSTEILQAMHDFTGNDCCVDWNDKPGRTKQEVLDMLNDLVIKHQPDEMRSNPDTPTA